MKKTYTKPMLHIEHFALSQNIAQSCGYKDEDYIGFPTQAEKIVCGWNDGSGEVYWTSAPGCSGDYSADLEIGEVCYNNPSGYPTVFAS